MANGGPASEVLKDYGLVVVALERTPKKDSAPASVAGPREGAPDGGIVLTGSINRKRETALWLTTKPKTSLPWQGKSSSRPWRRAERRKPLAEDGTKLAQFRTRLGEERTALAQASYPAGRKAHGVLGQWAH